MRKKVIIAIFIIITILQAIIPVKTNAFTEEYEIISVPAEIERQMSEEIGASGIDTATGLLLEPSVEFFTVVIDAIVEVVTAFMKQNEFEFVMVDEIDELHDLGEAKATFTIEDISPYKNVFGNLSIKYPNFTYSPEEIFAGNIDLLDVNFIKKSNDDTNWNKIRNVVSEWYKFLRMATIIGLLAVLIYTGIKIILSSNNAKDKAKYKEMIVNWFIAVILAFSMQYIMAFILSVIEEIMELLQGLSGVIEVQVGTDISFKTNLIGLARFQMQQQHFSAKIGHLVIYTALVVYTFKFTFIYLKRVLKMAFLTVISPIVALTYPIDKMDGKAKGFEMWIKEYTYNALLQPMHYILYNILVTSSLALAAHNPIYGIAALMFISEAERLLKRIFGFDKAKAGTVGGLAGAFATGAVTGALNNIVKDPTHPVKGLVGGKSSGNSGSGGGQRQLGTDYYDDSEFSGVRDDTNVDDYVNTDMRADYSNQNRETSDSVQQMPFVNDFISKYRQEIPQEDLGELSFSDGYGSMKSLMERIEDCEMRLKNPNLTDEQREKLNEKLFNYKTALQDRLTYNESGFSNAGVPLQYADGDSRTNSELMDEIMRLRKLASDPATPEKDRTRYGAEARRLFKKLKRRMSENEYIRNHGGAEALMEQERFRRLSETEESGESIDPVINGNAGPETEVNQNTRGSHHNRRRSSFIEEAEARWREYQERLRITGRNTNIGENAQVNQNINRTENARPSQNVNRTENAQPSQNVNRTENAQPSQNVNRAENNKANQNNRSNRNTRSTRRIRDMANSRDRQVEQRRQQRMQQVMEQQGIQQSASPVRTRQQQETEQKDGVLKRVKNAPVIKGFTNVGKTIIKPVWDTEKDTGYNTERLVRNVARTVVGATVGVAAAAVQAGISITDGKYKPMEGVATFGAGFVGGSGIVGRAEQLRQVYREGAYSEEDQESLERYSRQWFNRDDIISNYNRDFPGKGKEMRRRAVNNYVSRGITDFKQQKQAIKFAELLKKERGMAEEEADWIAVGTLRYRQNLVSNNNYNILFDSDKRKEYLDVKTNSYSGSASKDSIRRTHEDFLQNVMDFDRANR